MSELKNVIIGISGGIAAYKIPFLIRLFRKADINVKVVSTKNALNFVTPLTIETLSNNKLYYDQFSSVNEYSTEHISITDWGDCLIVAPATANCIAKFANGIADDALSTTFVSFNKEVFIAPAMNTKMWLHPSTQRNIEILKKQNVHFIEPEHGDLACGYEGVGRMREPEEIYEYVIDYFNNSQKLKSKKVLVTAGPTYEPIDAVRFIGNYSSGKMGYAIAECMAKQGAEVILISGPTNLSVYHKNITKIDVHTAEEMYEQVSKYFADADVCVMAAAVADYKVANPLQNKMKKSQETLKLEFVPTVDILKHLGQIKKENQLVIGFALETENELENAKLKLETKNADAIILNSLNDEGSGFQHDTNKIKIIDKERIINYPLMSKIEVAKKIVEYILQKIKS